SVSIETSLSLAEKIPAGVAKVTESGLSDAKTIVKLWQAGYDGFLIGEAFMKTSQPERTCAKLIRAIREERYAVGGTRAA
ncbi:MAG: hypothetical protein KDD44_06705, partial [Bdellovibrionales bacterium]|nr:hypothetical protein [Bdellovibrionales bacterium]